MLSDDLVALQALDSGLDQLGHRRARLAEREVLAAAEADRDAAARRVAAAEARRAELQASIEAAEADGVALTRQRERLEAQLKTVIAPREAEALMSELATIATRRDALDDAELEQLEEESRLDEELAAGHRAAPGLHEAVASAASALASAEELIGTEVAELSTARDELAARLDAAVLADYESRRRHYGGVAVGQLDGRRCGGCHLDLSMSEFEQVRATPPGEIADCPQCGRILVP